MIKFLYKQFLREPLWFKVLISSALLISILLSSSFFSAYGSYYQGISKLAAAIFFSAYGIKFRKNIRISAIFFVVAAICIYLSWSRLTPWDI